MPIPLSEEMQLALAALQAKQEVERKIAVREAVLAKRYMLDPVFHHRVRTTANVLMERPERVPVAYGFSRGDCWQDAVRDVIATIAIGELLDEQAAEAAS